VKVTSAQLDPHFRELSGIQKAPGGAPDLLQFRALVTARQYGPFYDAVARRTRTDDAILDWGCGNGHASWTLTRLGWTSLTGFSFEDFPLRARMPEAFRFVAADAADPVTLPFPDGHFDAVLSVGVLEHVRETGGTESASLREIRRVLRPGGTFICAHLPGRGSWIEAMTRRIPSAYNHPFLYTGEDIRTMVVEAGMELLEQRRYGMLPRNQWARAPRRLRNARWTANVWDRADALLGWAAPGLAQNHLWVARVPVQGLPAARATSGDE
jgi:SAM-dependent methyltransferase